MAIMQTTSKPSRISSKNMVFKSRNGAMSEEYSKPPRTESGLNSSVREVGVSSITTRDINALSMATARASVELTTGSPRG